MSSGAVGNKYGGIVTEGHFNMIILLLLCVIGLSSGLPRLGIVGGNVTDIKKLPYQAAALDPISKDLFCGAAIISRRHLLLAAHCCSQYNKFWFRMGSNYYEKGGTLIVSERLIIHPKFRIYNTIYPEYDACIAKLSKRIKYGPTVKPLRIGKRAPGAGAVTTVSGWGETEENDVSSVLRSVKVPVVNTTYCRDAYPGIGDMEMYVCAGMEGKDSCYGDSGGALQWKNTLVGIVSFGRACGEKGSPGVYTNVNMPEIREFIRNVTGV